MAKTNYVPHIPFEEYSERLKEHFTMKKEDGIVEARMHTLGGVCEWGLQIHRALGQLMMYIGQDPTVECFIFGGTGDKWLGAFDKESFDEYEAHGIERALKDSFDIYYNDGTRFVERFVWDLKIPTIVAVNGPAYHYELALMADITVMSENAELIEPHFFGDLVCGDGLYLAMAYSAMGVKRANYANYMTQGIGPKTCLEWGLVNEVVPLENLYDRCWEIAREIMAAPRQVRRMTADINKQYWRKVVAELEGQFAQEEYVHHLTMHEHNGKPPAMLFARVKERHLP
ncbi:MAG: enoyl-CoA hydratase/isomerase family protein [Agathobacter sp.]